VTTTSTTGRQRDELELRPRRVTPTAGRAWAFAGAAAGLAGVVGIQASLQIDAVYDEKYAGDADRITDRLGDFVPQLVITMDEDDESVVAAMRAGARGYLLKSASPAEVERGIRAVANGEAILGPQVASRAMATLTSGRTAVRVPFPELSDREREVLDLLARGYDNATIARRMVLSPKTVRNHVSNVLTKIGAPDRAQAMIRARDEGLGAS
jgi:DNA-binding NarL/FixJ family response regulator